METKETAIIILTHGDWGEKLVASAESIVGRMQRIHCFPFFPEQNIADYCKIVDRQLKEMESSYLILTDLFGSSTANVAGVLTRSHNCLAFSGLNLLMLITAYELRKETSEEKVIEDLLAAAATDLRCINQEIRLAEKKRKRD